MRSLKAGPAAEAREGLERIANALRSLDTPDAIEEKRRRSRR